MSAGPSPARFCRCENPVRATTAESAVYCETCEELLPGSQDELLAVMARATAKMSRQLDALTELLLEQAEPAGGASRAGASRAAPAPVASPPPLDTAEAARRLGKSHQFTRDHRDELGGFPLGPTGEGKKPRLGYDADRVEAFRCGQAGHVVAEQPKPARPRRRRPGTKLLEVKG
jgi:hypothetical protein